MRLGALVAIFGDAVTQIETLCFRRQTLREQPASVEDLALDCRVEMQTGTREVSGARLAHRVQGDEVKQKVPRRTLPRRR